MLAESLIGVHKAELIGQGQPVRFRAAWSGSRPVSADRAFTRGVIRHRPPWEEATVTAAGERAFERQFTTKRPWLYHLTATPNVARIRRVGQLHCAAALLRAGGRSEFIRRRRSNKLPVRVGTEIVHVRDQRPLHRNSMELCDGWSFEDWVAYLNDFVFFWPGSAGGPNPHGQRHFARYASERPALIRVPTADLFAANRRASPRFSCYNSGSPRYWRGRPSPRGPGTFASGSRFAGPASNVVEVVFQQSALLPATGELADGPQGPWRPLFDDAGVGGLLPEGTIATGATSPEV